jgi:hypothetical protein
MYREMLPGMPDGGLPRARSVQAVIAGWFGEGVEGALDGLFLPGVLMNTRKRCANIQRCEENPFLQNCYLRGEFRG